MSKEYVVELVKSELRRRDKQWHAAFKKMFADMRIPTVPEAAIIIERPNKRIYPAKLFEKAATPAKPPTTLSAAGGKAVPLLPTTRVAVENSEAIPKCQKAILQVLASRAGAVSDRLVALQSGYSIKSSGFKNALSWLRTRDLIKGGKASLALTDEGRIVAARFANEPVPVSDPSYWESKLPKCERAIFKTLRTVAHPVDRESLAAGAGYSVTSSGFKNALSKLRGLALIEGSDLIQLTPELFQ